ncbi:MAG: hypothetical protein AB7K08_08985 [Microbacteriaceae bacterium]
MPRRTPLQIVDIVAGIALLLIAMLIGLIMLAYTTQLGTLSSECAGIDPDGMRCSPEFLSASTITGTGTIVFAWFLAAGFLIVRAIQRKVVFFLPVIAVVVMIAGFYLVTALIGTSYLPSSST